MPLKRLNPNDQLKDPVKVIDSPMGVGKTNYMLDYVSRNKDQLYLIAVPYLTETNRWDESVEHLEQPNDNNHANKSDHLKELLADKTSIITTHSLFKRLDNDSLDLIRDAGYTLIIDETLSCIKPLDIHRDDIDSLIKSERLKVVQGVEYEHLEWIDKNYNGYMAKGIKECIQAAEAVVSDDSYFNIMRPDKIKSFTNVYVLTYMFDSSLMSSYFRLKGIDIPYKKYSVKDGQLTGYFDPMGRPYKGLIDLHDQGTTNKKRLKRLETFSLSYSFYLNSSSTQLTEIKNVTRSYFDGFNKDRAPNMFTVFKPYEPKISTHRFQKMEEDSEGKRKNVCFVSLNARATNNYAHKTRLAYLVNRFSHPFIDRMLKKHESSIDQDSYALSELIQWIFRSAIRNNKPISLFIPSKRMRDLLIKWLDGETLETSQK